MVKKILNSIFFKFWLFLDERINFKNKLDYPKNDIMMETRSKIELYRLNSCQKEPGTVKWLEENIKKGDVFFDIGANVGAYSLIAYAITSGECIVYAFEPSFSTYNALCKNILINKAAGKIIPLNIGLSDQTEIQRFTFYNIEAGSALHCLGSPTSKYLSKVDSLVFQPILTFTLDQLIQEFKLKQPNHIKIDVDGNELLILKGMIATLQEESLKTIIIEVDKDESSAEKIVNLLTQYGYSIECEYPHGNSNIVDFVFINLNGLDKK